MGQSILIIEDNLKLAKLLQQCLFQAGYMTTHEKRGDKAVYRIVHEQPDLVILDIMLPGLNGQQVCQTVRPDYRGKLLMLTALDDIQREVTSLNEGADDYLTKPVANEVLLARVAALLRRPQLSNKQRSYTFGSLSLDLARKTFSLDKQEMTLSPNEFDLLALLVVNHDTTLSRDTITQILKGREYDGVDRSIDIRISRLRKVFNDETHQKRIKTMHGKGYMFISST